MAFVRSKVATCAQVADILHCQIENVPYPTPLCKHHYHILYNTLQSQQMHCYTCGSSLRSGQTRICPDAKTIQQYLAERTGLEGEIPENARVCYKAQLLIIKEAPVSTDNDLETLISELKKKHTAC